ncbi:hypothetical protein J3R83DRAFT_6509 [Lanmaoa asiatica]|nr:hypothetical protein J3R83DRAFT_6509 [Lanmaoa asiatica]
MRSSLIPSFLCFALYFSAALSFSVTVGSSPTQCGSLNVTWTGGQAPFEIMLTPAFDIPRNVSVPSTAFNNNQGSYQVSPIPFIEGTRLLLTMSDASGFGTGGTSDILTVGAPVGSASCNTSNPSLLFSFNLPSSLKQCSSYVFNEYDGAILPITITGLIPGGDSFLIHPPPTGTSYSWIADVAAGTTIVFTLTDAQGRSGGSSDTQTVALSNDASCLNPASPSSTVSSVTSSTSSPQTSSGVSTGTIIGAAVGAVLAITSIVALVVFFLKRQRYGRSSYGLASSRNSHRPNSVELDPGIDNFQHPPIYPFPYHTDSASRLAPPFIPGSPSTPVSHHEMSSTEIPYTLQQHSRTNSNTDSFAALGDVASSSMSSSARRKAAMAGMTSYQPATRFIVHTDAEDHVSEDEAEVVELPPQYSVRQTPAARHTGERPMSSVTGLSSTDFAYLSEQQVDEAPQSYSPSSTGVSPSSGFLYCKLYASYFPKPGQSHSGSMMGTYVLFEEMC